jgi:hypothetical protein
MIWAFAACNCGQNWERPIPNAPTASTADEVADAVAKVLPPGTPLTAAENQMKEWEFSCWIEESGLELGGVRESFLDGFGDGTAGGDPDLVASRLLACFKTTGEEPGGSTGTRSWWIYLGLPDDKITGVAVDHIHW